MIINTKITGFFFPLLLDNHCEADYFASSLTSWKKKDFFHSVDCGFGWHIMGKMKDFKVFIHGRALWLWLY